MSANSLESLLNRMNGRSITNGWGAIVAFGRAQLNRLLQERYLVWLQEGRFIPPITGEVYTDGRTESMALDSLIFGRPVLSFESSSLNKSLVTLTMNIVAGTYTHISRPVGGGASAAVQLHYYRRHGLPGPDESQPEPDTRRGR